MKFPYIVAIIFGVIFVVLFIVFLVVYARKRRHDAARRALIEKTYLSEPGRMDYDFAAYDEETERLLAGIKNEESQLTIDEMITAAAPAVEDGMFVKMEIDEPEEITGNYKPE